MPIPHRANRPSSYSRTRQCQPPDINADESLLCLHAASPLRGFVAIGFQRTLRQRVRLIQFVANRGRDYLISNHAFVPLENTTRLLVGKKLRISPRLEQSSVSAGDLRKTNFPLHHTPKIFLALRQHQPVVLYVESLVSFTNQVVTILLTNCTAPSIHAMEKEFKCQFCENLFKKRNEAKRHEESMHLRPFSWSCAAIANFEAAFHPLKGSSCDVCGYCGEGFLNSPRPDWTLRLDHLRIAHRFDACNQNKKFFRADHFRQHLMHRHAARKGEWTQILVNASFKDESSSKWADQDPNKAVPYFLSTNLPSQY